MTTKIDYPYVDEKEVQRIRRMKKEEIVSYLCFTSKRTDIADTATRELVEAATDASMTHEEFRILALEVINKIFMSNLHLMKAYSKFIKDIDVPTQVVVHKMNAIDKEDEETPCDDCGSRNGYDPKDINVN